MPERNVKILMLFLLQIAKRYDILLIQEIRDKSETTIDIFVDAINTDIGFVSSLAATHITMSFTQFPKLSIHLLFLLY